MLSGCSYSSERPTAESEGDAGDTVESFEFFVWSRCSFIATFLGMYILSPTLNAELRELVSGRVASRFIWLSTFSEALTILGFYLSSIAYGLFYQVRRCVCVMGCSTVS